MPERVIVTDEWYPVYDLEKVKPHHRDVGFWAVIDVPPDLIKDWKRCQREFERIQTRLAKLNNQAHDKRPSGERLLMTMASCASLDLHAPIVPYFPLDLGDAS